MSLAETSRPGITPQLVEMDRAHVQFQLLASASDLKLKWKFSAPSFEISDLPQSLPAPDPDNHQEVFSKTNFSPPLLIQIYFLPCPQTRAPAV